MTHSPTVRLQAVELSGFKHWFESDHPDQGQILKSGSQYENKSVHVYIAVMENTKLEFSVDTVRLCNVVKF